MRPQEKEEMFSVHHFLFSLYLERAFSYLCTWQHVRQISDEQIFGAIFCHKFNYRHSLTLLDWNTNLFSALSDQFYVNHMKIDIEQRRIQLVGESYILHQWWRMHN